MKVDLNCVYVPKIISAVLTEVAAMDDFSMKISRLNQFVASLEEELKMIEAFQREVPFCTGLLNDAIERLKEEALQYKGKVPRIEEFISLKGNSDENGREKKSNDIGDMKSWTSSAQLWTTPVQYENVDLGKQSGGEESDGNGGEREKQYQEQLGGAVKEVENGLTGRDLSLPLAVVEIKEIKAPNSVDVSQKKDKGRSNECDFLQEKPHQKKQRRIWSPELHGKFVDAILQLGGAQAATPRQIRKMMQVDSMTYNEVKSHLQKYRSLVAQVTSSPSSVDGPGESSNIN